MLAGGGHAHALVLLGLGRRPLRGVEITLVSDVERAPYSGMLPGHIAGLYQREEMHIDLRRLCAFAGARLVLGRVDGLELSQASEPASKIIRCDGTQQHRLEADILSINVGGAPKVEAAEAVPCKPVHALLAGWDRLRTVAFASQQPLRLLIAGGGAGGVELALAMRAQLPAATQITLIHEGTELMPGHPENVREVLRKALAQKQVWVLVNQRLMEARPGEALLAGDWLAADFIFYATPVSAPAWLEKTGLALTSEGFIRVDHHLQSINTSGVFAAGDVEAMEGAHLPRSGVVAVRMARPLEHNLRAALEATPLAAYHPQRQWLGLIGTGDRRAVVSRPGWPAWHGRTIWWWKQWIDRRFMRPFATLPPND